MKKKVEVLARNRHYGISPSELMLFLDTELRPRLALAPDVRVGTGFRQQLTRITVEWESDNEDRGEA